MAADVSIGVVWLGVAVAALGCFVLGCVGRTLFLASARHDNRAAIRGEVYDVETPAHRSIGAVGATRSPIRRRHSHRRDCDVDRGAPNDWNAQPDARDQQQSILPPDDYEAELSEGMNTDRIVQVSSQLSQYQRQVDAEIDERRLSMGLSTISQNADVAAAIRQALSQQRVSAGDTPPPHLFGDEDSIDESPPPTHSAPRRDLSALVVSRLTRNGLSKLVGSGFGGDDRSQRAKKTC